MKRVEESVHGIIPASGSSTRMGTPKALLDADGRSFLERVALALVNGGCASLLVVLRDPGSPLAAMARKIGAEVVENPDPAEGPVGSLQRGIEALPPDAEGCVFCPVDHPLVTAETVAALVAAFRDRAAKGSPPPVVAPTWNGTRGHPVLFASGIFPELLEEGLEEGARTVVHRHLDRLVEVPVDDEGVVIDIDTLPEYRRRFPNAWRKRFQSR